MLIAELVSDYRRHGNTLRNPALWAVANYHFGVWAKQLKVPPVRWLASKLYGTLAFGVELASGITLHRESLIGQDFHVVHSGNVKIHPGVRIGNRVGVMHDVTIGVAMNRRGVPVIGDDVFIGAGARILGPVLIGNGAHIAANTVVLSDVPPGATAIGVPARILRYTGRPTSEGSLPETSDRFESSS